MDKDLRKVIKMMMDAPVAQLEAIYNHAWREHHNDIKVEKNHSLMQDIRFVAGRRNIAITGRGGSWEFKQNGHG